MVLGRLTGRPGRGVKGFPELVFGSLILVQQQWDRVCVVATWADPVAHVCLALNYNSRHEAR